MAEIRFENVKKTYGEDTIIPDMNMTIKDGSFTVIVGPSGCGKSTTLRMIAGLETQTEGNIYIGDRLVNDVSPGKRNVSMVFQNYALYPTMSVKGNIEFGLKNRKVPKAERQKLIEEVAEIVGLTPYLNKKPQKLSGGQRQRVALARAMVKKTRCLYP
ncbi:ABC transporter ATP-binding protein [Geomicrobium sp. JCM 19055]|uniref:ABC transporter ATP-binding protein n=1 Tax=Geomicrobium sp. JCM 19055 TaxID=1460649 RepID=UPI000A674852